MDYDKLDAVQLLTIKLAYSDIWLQMQRNIKKIDEKLEQLEKEKKKQ